MRAKHGIQLARVDLQRSWRRLVGTRRGQVLVGIILFGFGIMLIGSLQSMYQFGKLSTEIPSTSILPIAQQQLASIFVLMVIIIVIRTIERLSRIDAKEFLLTTISPRTVVLGVLLAEFSRLGLTFGLLMGVYTVAFVLGSGSYLSLVIIPAAAIPLLAVTLLSGYLIGLFARIAAVRLTRGSFLKYAFVVLGVLAFGVVVQPILVTAGVLSTPIIEIPINLLDITLFGWYATLFFIGTPFSTPLPIESFAVASGLIAAIPLLFEGVVRLASILWYGDSGHARRTTSETPLRRAQPPRGATSNRSAWLAWWFCRRNLRRPRYFGRLGYLAFIFGLPALQMLSNPDELYRYGPVLVSIVGAVLSGELFAIMSFKSEGQILPLILTTPGGSRLFAHARILAGLLFGLPVIVGGVLIIGLLGGWGAIWIIAAIIFGSALAGASTTLALALGAFSSSVQWQPSVRDETITANSFAVGVHTVGITVLGILGFAFLLAPEFIQSILGDSQWSQTTVSIGGIVLLIGLLTVLAGGCYRYAVCEYDSMSLSA